VPAPRRRAAGTGNGETGTTTAKRTTAATKAAPAKRATSARTRAAVAPKAPEPAERPAEAREAVALGRDAAGEQARPGDMTAGASGDAGRAEWAATAGAPSTETVQK
jgi:hypothetical protein